MLITLNYSISFQTMQVNKEYLHGLGLGLQGLRATGQFCDAMVCVGSARILVIDTYYLLLFAIFITSSLLFHALVAT